MHKDLDGIGFRYEGVKPHNHRGGRDYTNEMVRYENPNGDTIKFKTWIRTRRRFGGRLNSQFPRPRQTVQAAVMARSIGWGVAGDEGISRSARNGRLRSARRIARRQYCHMCDDRSRENVGTFPRHGAVSAKYDYPVRNSNSSTRMSASIVRSTVAPLTRGELGKTKIKVQRVDLGIIELLAEAGVATGARARRRPRPRRATGRFATRRTRTRTRRPTKRPKTKRPKTKRWNSMPICSKLPRRGHRQASWRRCTPSRSAATRGSRCRCSIPRRRRNRKTTLRIRDHSLKTKRTGRFIHLHL